MLKGVEELQLIRVYMVWICFGFRDGIIILKSFSLKKCICSRVGSKFLVFTIE